MHRLWQDPTRLKEPLLGHDATGITSLILYILGLPASTNLKNYQDYVSKALPAFPKRAQRVLEKHEEDQCYAEMRQDLESQIPVLKMHLEEIVPIQLQNIIATPWADSDKPKIIDGIRALFAKDSECSYPHIQQISWAKMLRENGIPINGVLLGRNFNEDVSQALSPLVVDWSTAMSDRVEGLAQRMYRPIQAALAEIQLAVHECTAVPELMDATIDTLADVSSTIEETYEKFMDDLRDTLSENRLKYTTESDVECPVAKSMKPSCQRALNPTFVRTGQGIFRRQKIVLQDSIFTPSKHGVRLTKPERIGPLVDSLKDQIVSSQHQVWTNDCTKFITSVVEELEGFLGTTQELLMDAEFMTPEHQAARKELERLLVYFDESLIEVQNDFKDLVDQPPAKKVKVEEMGEGGSSDATDASDEGEPANSEEELPANPDEELPANSDEELLTIRTRSCWLTSTKSLLLFPAENCLLFPMRSLHQSLKISTEFTPSSRISFTIQGEV